MNKRPAKRLIFAYGFDQQGFALPTDPIEGTDYVMHYIPHRSSQSLETADAVIFASGIFEQIKYDRRFNPDYGEMVPDISVNCDKHHLAKREKEITEVTRNGGWIAALLGYVETAGGRYTDTDLAKKYLDELFSVIETEDPIAHVDCKDDAFAKYLHDYGIARTTFAEPRERYNARTLATAPSGASVAAELNGKFFFLPLQPIARDQTILKALLQECVAAVLEYKRRHDFYLPVWVNEIEFKSETLIKDEISKLEQIIKGKRDQLDTMRRYKGILSCSGNTLNELVVKILREYFRLDVPCKEKFVEDAIINVKGKPAFVIEIKGVKAGLKREHINQVDSHRERLGISHDVPGLLIINDFSDIDGVLERRAQKFDVAQINHAAKLNVKILRTTTLLDIMLTLEDASKRTKPFLELCKTAAPMVGAAKSS